MGKDRRRDDLLMKTAAMAGEALVWSLGISRERAGTRAKSAVPTGTPLVGCALRSVRTIRLYVCTY